MGKLLVVASRFLLLSLLLAPPNTATAQGVTLQPASGPVNTGITATGTGWPPGAEVYAFFNQQSVSMAPKTVDSKGNFSLDFCVPNLPPGVNPTYFTISTLPGMYSGPIFTITAGTAGNCQPAMCKPAFFIGLRGSGEGATYGSLGNTINAFYENFKIAYGEDNVDVYGVPYPAIAVPNFAESHNLDELSDMLHTFGSSVAEGITKLSNVLIGQHAVCPDQRFLIVGYSQGAWVTGDALAALDDTILSHVAAVVLLGDPKLRWRDPDVEGIATKFPWVSGGLPSGGGPRQRYMPGVTDWNITPTQLGNFQFRSYCEGQDPICNATKMNPADFVPGVPDSPGTTEWLGWLDPCLNLDANVCEHMMYALEPLPTEVANWFAERLAAPATPTPPSDVTLAIDSNGFGIGVSWKDHSDDETGFDIAYSPDPNNSPIKHYQVQADQTFISSDWGLSEGQSGLLSGQKMCFQVSAFSATGYSAPTPWGCIMTP
jgi:hypothetical protein